MINLLVSTVWIRIYITNKTAHNTILFVSTPYQKLHGSHRNFCFKITKTLLPYLYCIYNISLPNLNTSLANLQNPMTRPLMDFKQFNESRLHNLSSTSTKQSAQQNFWNQELVFTDGCSLYSETL